MKVSAPEILKTGVAVVRSIESIMAEIQGNLCDKLTIALFSIESISLNFLSEYDKNSLERAKLAIQDAGKIAQMLYRPDFFDQLPQERQVEGEEG